MPKAGIAIDNWKLPIFERHLSQAGYAFKTATGLTKDAMVVSVVTDNMEALAEVVKAANAEAARTGKPHCQPPSHAHTVVPPKPGDRVYAGLGEWGTLQPDGRIELDPLDSGTAPGSD